MRTYELPPHELLEEMFRVLKPGGVVVIQMSQLAEGITEVVSTLKRGLLVAGFLVPPEDDKPLIVMANKSLWKIGSSVSIKKTAKVLPKVQIDVDMDLIDEDSLLTEEDFSKPQLPVAGDCEVGSTRKAWKNFTCGRAEEEDKVEKLGLTMDQIDNPQSACDSNHKIWSFMRGKLYIHFTVDFPDSLSPEKCKALEAVIPPRTSMQMTDMELDECEETTLHDRLKLSRKLTMRMMICLTVLKGSNVLNSRKAI